MSQRVERRYIPLSQRDNFGQLNFPRLRDRKVVIPTLVDTKQGVPNGGSTVKPKKARISKANKRLDEKLGATSEFRRVRNNISYKPILDFIGEDFPLHPEYLYVIGIIVSYYGVPFTDVLEFGLHKERLNANVGGKGCVNAILTKNTVSVSSCFNMLMYFLFSQYECNPNVILSIFGISVGTLRTSIESVSRQYDMSEAVRQDYSTLHSRLIAIEQIHE